MFQFSLIDVFYGALLGCLCVGGLTLGVGALFRASQNQENKKISNRYTAIGVGALVLQFVLAGWFVFKIAKTLRDPLSFGMGLIGVILIASLVMKMAQKEP